MIENIATSAATVWIVAAAMLLALCIAAANDSFTAAFLGSVLGLAVLQFLTVADPIGFVKENPRAVGFAALAYIPAGIAWSVFRWWKLLQRKAAELRAAKPGWKPRWESETWDKFVDKEMPAASLNKERIICWIAYWPFSALAYVLIDFLREVGEWIYTRIRRLYEAMAERVKATLKTND